MPPARFDGVQWKQKAMVRRVRGTSRLSGRIAIQFLLCALIVSSSAAARAQATDRMNANAPSAPAVSFRKWAIELNPLELAVARASVNFEVALTAHDALMLTSRVQPSTADIGAGVWGELGYRVYSGDGGLQGFFIGPSVGAGAFSYFTDQSTGEQDARSFNVAADCGYQFAWRSGLVLGFGLGAQYQHVWHDYPVRNDPINQFELESTVLPRVLFSVGYGG